MQVTGSAREGWEDANSACLCDFTGNCRLRRLDCRRRSRLQRSCRLDLFGPVPYSGWAPEHFRRALGAARSNDRAVDRFPRLGKSACARPQYARITAALKCAARAQFALDSGYPLHRLHQPLATGRWSGSLRHRPCARPVVAVGCRRVRRNNLRYLGIMAVGVLVLAGCNQREPTPEEIAFQQKFDREAVLVKTCGGGARRRCTRSDQGVPLRK